MAKKDLKNNNKGLPFKEDEESSYYAQFIISKKPDNKIIVTRVLLILLYIIFAIAYSALFLVVVKIPYVIAILPGLVVVLWFFTWKRTKIEYAYISRQNTFYVYRINGLGKSQEILKVNTNETLGILPASDDFSSELKEINPNTYLDYSSSVNCEDRYIGVWDINGNKTGIYFDASSKLLNSLKYFGGERVVVTYVSR